MNKSESLKSGEPVSFISGNVTTITSGERRRGTRRARVLSARLGHSILVARTGWPPRCVRTLKRTKGARDAVRFRSVGREQKTETAPRWPKSVEFYGRLTTPYSLAVKNKVLIARSFSQNS